MASNVYLSIWGALWLIANMCFSAECTAQERPPLQPRPERGPVSPPQPLPQACSRITSFTPASARPGESVDIFLEPGSRASLRYTVVGVEFTSGVSAVFTPISLTEARTKVPLAATAGHLRVYCRTIFGGTNIAESTTDFSPIAFGQTLQPNALSLFVGASAQVAATLSDPAPEPVTLTIAPQSNHVSVESQPPGAAATITIPSGQRSMGFTVSAQSGGGTSVTVTGHNITPATLSVNVPTPSFQLMLSSTNAETHWGNPASYAIEVSSRNGFAGTVTLTPQNLPFGASSAPASVSVPINGSTTANLTITTINGGTALGQHSFPLRAESPGVVADVRTLDLHVLPAEGAFGPLSWLLLVPRSCDSVNADITTDPADPNGGPAVKFQGNSFASGALPVAYYAYTPDCRGAVVFSPSTVQGNPVHIVNLKFPNQIADPPGHSYRLNPAAYNQNQFRVGGDGSYLIVADESGGSGHATLWNMLDLSQTPSSHQYSIAGALNAQIAGNMVEVSDSVGGSFNWVLP